MTDERAAEAPAAPSTRKRGQAKASSMASSIDALDLKKYASAYRGVARIQRLEFIADACPSLRVEALKLAIHYTEATFNIKNYTSLHKKLVDSLKAQNSNPAAAAGAGAAAGVSVGGAASEEGARELPTTSSACSLASGAPSGVDSDGINAAGAAQEEHEPVATLDVDPVVDGSQHIVSGPVTVEVAADGQVSVSFHVVPRSCLAFDDLSKTEPGIPHFNHNWVNRTAVMASKVFGNVFSQFYDDPHYVLKKLGDLYLKCGELSLAADHYTSAATYSEQVDIFVSDCLCIMKTAILSNQWTKLMELVHDVETTAGLSDMDSLKVAQTSTSIAIGLSEMQMHNYKTVPYFLLRDFGWPYLFREIVSRDNLIVYAGLCMLATLPRHRWKKRLGDPKNPLSALLSPESSMRDIIQKFYDCDFRTGLWLLRNIKDFLMLDIYLAPHVSRLFKLIRKRVFIDYVSQFIMLKIEQVVKVFPNYNVAKVERALEQMIAKGELRMHLDKQNHVVYSLVNNDA